MVTTTGCRRDRPDHRVEGPAPSPRRGAVASGRARARSSCAPRRRHPPATAVTDRPRPRRRRACGRGGGAPPPRTRRRDSDRLPDEPPRPDSQDRRRHRPPGRSGRHRGCAAPRGCRWPGTRRTASARPVPAGRARAAGCCGRGPSDASMPTGFGWSSADPHGQLRRDQELLDRALVTERPCPSRAAVAIRARRPPSRARAIHACAISSVVRTSSPVIRRRRSHAHRSTS